MLGSVLAKTVRDALRGLPWWVLGIALLLVATLAAWPTVRDNPEWERIAEESPELLAFFGGEGLRLTQPAGYLDSQLFSFMVPLLLLIYGIGAGARAVAGEEEAGTLELLLANPVSRTRLVLEKAGAIAVLLVLLAAVLYLVTLASAALFGMDVGATALAWGTLSSLLLALDGAALALLLGSATGVRSLALAVPAGILVASWLLDSLANIVGALEPWDVLSLYAYAGGGQPVGRGLGGVDLAVLLGVAAVAAALAPAAFARRDVAIR